MRVHIFATRWRDHQARLSKLREIVFIDEQSVPREIEWDGLDDDCEHFLAVSEFGDDLGCARLTPAGQIGRMAVLPAHRGTGIGRQLLEFAVGAAQSRGLDRVFLHAQDHAIGFYRAGGFLPYGEVFEEAGIPHRAMEKPLALNFVAEHIDAAPHIQQSPATPAPPPSEITLFSGETESRDELYGCLKLPERTLAIASYALDPFLFDTTEAETLISSFARRAPLVTVRVLIATSDRMVTSGHRLADLAQRLSSKIKVRKLDDEHADESQTFVVWDRLGFWNLPDYREYKGFHNPNDRVTAARLTERFDYLWERAQPDPNLRALKI